MNILEIYQTSLQRNLTELIRLKDLGIVTLGLIKEPESKEKVQKIIENFEKVINEIADFS